MRYFGGSEKSLQPEGVKVPVAPVRRPVAAANRPPPQALIIRGRRIPMRVLRERAAERFRINPDNQQQVTRATVELIARLNDGRDPIEDFDSI